MSRFFLLNKLWISRCPFARNNNEPSRKSGHPANAEYQTGMAESSIRLLPFQQHIIEQLSAPGPESDGLLLLARGLGLRSVLCTFLEAFSEEASLAVVLNATPEEENGLSDELGQRITLVRFETPAKDR